MSDAETEARLLEVARAQIDDQVEVRRAIILFNWTVQYSERNPARILGRHRDAFVGGPMRTKPTECRYYRFIAYQDYAGPGEWNPPRYFRSKNVEPDQWRVACASDPGATAEPAATEPAPAEVTPAEPAEPAATEP
jgi:hypothetical protein